MKRGIEILRTASVVLVLGLAAVAAWVFFVEPNRLAVKHLEFEIPGLPEELDGLRIAFLCDLHDFPAPSAPGLLDRIARRVREEQPDLILFGGDFVHGVAPADAPDSMTDLTEYLRRFSAPLGCFAVFGNHELWFVRQMVRRSVEGAGCQMLTGEVRRLTFRGKEFLLLGVDDYSTSPKGKNTVPEELPQTGALIVLAHAPASAKFLPPHRNAILFSGHTHGGQIRIPGCRLLRSLACRRYPVDAEGYRPDRDPETEYEYCFERGLYSLKGNQIFVSSGVGGDRIIARLGCTPEIILATLRRPGRSTAPEIPQQLYESRKQRDEIR